MPDKPKAWTGTAGKLVIGAFALALVGLLFTEHRLHVLGWLPFLLLLLCPLLHMSMHGGHGGHDQDESNVSGGANPPHRH